MFHFSSFAKKMTPCDITSHKSTFCILTSARNRRDKRVETYSQEEMESMAWCTKIFLLLDQFPEFPHRIFCSKTHADTLTIDLPNLYTFLRLCIQLLLHHSYNLQHEDFRITLSLTLVSLPHAKRLEHSGNFLIE